MAVVVQAGERVVEHRRDLVLARERRDALDVGDLRT